MAAGFVRMKVAATLLGPAGVGLIGLFTQSTGLVSSVAGLGLGSSAVREVAAAEGAGDPAKLARVVVALKVLVWGTGVLGALICVLLATPLSRWTFGDQTHATEFAWLGLALFFGQLSAGQSALLRGLGRIRELAIQGVVVAVGSTLAAVACYVLWREAGVVPSFIAIAAVTLAGSWWYARTVRVPAVALSSHAIMGEGRMLLRMGVAFLWSGLVGVGVTYAIAILVRRELGVEGNGLYQAAWGISGLFVGFVLTAMGQDFYPRLTALVHKPDEACKLINQQTEVGILLALPGLVATVALIEWVLPLLYSARFLPAAGAVAWFSLGCFGRILSWPLGFSQIARGDSLGFSLTESVFGLIHLGLAWIGMRYHGLDGLGVAFALLYLLYTLGMRWVVGAKLGFAYSDSVLKLAALGVAVLILARYVGPWIGVALAGGTSLVCLRGIVVRLGGEHPLVVRLYRLPMAARLLGPASGV